MGKEISNDMEVLIKRVGAQIAWVQKDILLWDLWVKLLLESLEDEASRLDEDHPVKIEKTFRFIAAAIAARLEHRRW